MASKKRKKQHGNPAAAPQASRRSITPASQWGKVAAFDLALPSGNVALVRRPGLVELLGAGIFPDEVLAIINKSIEDAKKRAMNQPVEPDKTPEDIVKETAEDPKKLASMYRIFDLTCAYAVVEPRVAYHMREGSDPENLEVIPEADRDPNIVYTDRIVDSDKIFIFNFVVGGSNDLSRFRKEQLAAVAAVSNGEGVLDDSEPALEDQRSV